MTNGKQSLDDFVCQQCGYCCSLPGYVILKEGEAEKIAAFLEMNVYDFTREYTVLTNGRRDLTLVEHGDGRCIFLQDDNTCRIHSVKPSQCIGFPRSWTSRELEKGCEGFRILRAE
ncbi:MAG: YkgJ family cysteine cluster protein [Kiritimatiellia bacterium]